MNTPDFNGLFNLNEIDELLDNRDRDPYRKEIGDRVQILDYSSCTHLNGRPLDFDFEDDEMNFNFITTFIVAETGHKTIYDAYFKKYRQDLIIANPLTNKQYRINSGHVRLK